MRWIPTVAHRPTLVVNLLLALQYSAMDLGNYGVGVCNAALNLRNDDAGFHEVATAVGNGFHAYSAVGIVILRAH